MRTSIPGNFHNNSGATTKNVYTDVKDLVELGLLAKDERGLLTAPFDEIVIHATVRDAA